jgi:hypothetical protein
MNEAMMLGLWCAYSRMVDFRDSAYLNEIYKKAEVGCEERRKEIQEIKRKEYEKEQSK